MNKSVLRVYAILIILLVSGILSTATAEEDMSFELGGWYCDSWNSESHSRYMNNDDLFSEVSPFWYDLCNNTSGNVCVRSYAYDEDNIDDVHNNNDLMIPSISDQYSGQMDNILNTTWKRNKLIGNIVSLTKSESFDGIDLNFESISSSNTKKYTNFIDDLADDLHSESKLLYVTIKPARNSTEEAWEAFDYSGLSGTDADRFRIMLYDYNWIFPGGGLVAPIGPIDWAEDVLDFAIGEGIDADRIQAAIHTYAWVWELTGGTDGIVGWGEAEWDIQTPWMTYSNLSSLSSSFIWDGLSEESATAYVYDGEAYVAYVGNADVISSRISMVTSYELAGIVLFLLGREDPEIYTVLDEYGPCSSATNIALNKDAEASSEYNGYYVAERAVWGNQCDGWLADPNESTAWWKVDLGQVYDLCEITIHWGNYDWATSYVVSVSDNGTSWTTAYSNPSAEGGNYCDTPTGNPYPDNFSMEGYSGRYVKIDLDGKADNWSYEIYEFQVFGY